MDTKTLPAHGTPARYKICKCKICTDGNTARVNRGKMDRAQREPQVHNASTYANWGCKCDVCVIDNRRVMDAKRRAAGEGSNSKSEWTEDELALITKRDATGRYLRTALSLALDLGRSVGAVNQKRSLANLKAQRRR